MTTKHTPKVIPYTTIGPQVKEMAAEIERLTVALVDAVDELDRLAHFIGLLTEEQATDICIPDATLIARLRATLSKYGKLGGQ